MKNFIQNAFRIKGDKVTLKTLNVKLKTEFESIHKNIECFGAVRLEKVVVSGNYIFNRFNLRFYAQNSREYFTCMFFIFLRRRRQRL